MVRTCSDLESHNGSVSSETLQTRPDLLDFLGIVMLGQELRSHEKYSQDEQLWNATYSTQMTLIRIRMHINLSMSMTIAHSCGAVARMLMSIPGPTCME
jgi:hypothetical protein